MIPKSGIPKGGSQRVTIYTDGACSGNPGPGGWGAVLTFGDREKELKGGEQLTTNNRMELMAAISALEALKKPCVVDLTTDSQYVRKLRFHQSVLSVRDYGVTQPGCAA